MEDVSLDCICSVSGVIVGFGDAEFSSDPSVESGGAVTEGPTFSPGLNSA